MQIEDLDHDDEDVDDDLREKISAGKEFTSSFTHSCITTLFHSCMHSSLLFLLVVIVNTFQAALRDQIEDAQQQSGSPFSSYMIKSRRAVGSASTCYYGNT